MNRVDPGHLLAGQHVQAHRRDRRARGGRHHAGDDVLLPGPARRLRHRLPLPQEGRPRHRRPAARDRAVLQRLLLQRRRAPRDPAHREVGEDDGPRRADRHRPAARGAPGSCRARSGSSACFKHALVRGRDGVGRDRPGPGERDAAADGAGRRGHRERRQPACGRTSSAARPSAPTPRRPRHQALDDRGGQGGDARGGGRGHRLARAAPSGRGRAARPARRRWWPRRAWRSRRTRDGAAAARLVPRASPPPTTRRSRWRSSSSTAGAAASRRRRWRAEILAHYFGLDRRPGPAPPASQPHRGGRLGCRSGSTAGCVYNVDWVLLGATLLLALVGRRDDLLRHPLRAHARPLPEAARPRRRSGRSALVVTASARLPAPRRPRDAALRPLASWRSLYVLRFAPVDRGHAPLDRDRRASSCSPRSSSRSRPRSSSRRSSPSTARRASACATSPLPGAAVGLLALLIAREPDLGTAACLVPLLLAVAFLAGLRMRAVVGARRGAGRSPPRSPGRS